MISLPHLRNHACRVMGGSVQAAHRLTRDSNLGWEMTVLPSSTGAVTVVLLVPADCTADGAICVEEGKMR